MGALVLRHTRPHRVTPAQGKREEEQVLTSGAHM
jgi:hypothetical protein